MKVRFEQSDEIVRLVGADAKTVLWIGQEESHCNKSESKKRIMEDRWRISMLETYDWPLSLSVTVPPFSLFLDRILAGRFNLSPRTTCLSSPSLRNETSPCPALDEYEMAELLGEIERNR